MNEEAEPLESPGGFARLLAVLSAGAIAVILGSAGEVAQVLPAFWTSFITAALMGFFGSLISSVVALWSLLSVRLRVDIERVIRSRNEMAAVGNDIVSGRNGDGCGRCRCLDVSPLRGACRDKMDRAAGGSRDTDPRSRCLTFSASRHWFPPALTLLPVQNQNEKGVSMAPLLIAFLLQGPRCPPICTPPPPPGLFGFLLALTPLWPVLLPAALALGFAAVRRFRR